MPSYVEHTNVTVKNIDEAIEFIQLALPDFKVRHQGENGYRWAHIGTQDSYIALQEMTDKENSNRTPYNDVGINHIGIVVDDALAVEQRLLDAGYRLNEINENSQYRKRVYFFDNSGIEWEFIQYFSADNALKNHYPS
ncbi:MULTISPECIES: VOC family protein [Vibrio]|uniref:VOC family protein n=2 Tax=Vibrio TaxID=662 RepID=A0A7X4LHK9_9VIBR|nr:MULTISPECIES: VOC family protein [Vibrio]MBF9001544.1 VOC family protein [Vibrio nitrifigilis]MZI91782.1 VOC family protein [Vibrio eleionomae]